MRWPWSPRPRSADSQRALVDSERALEESRHRWHRVNEVADRAEQASHGVRSQRDQNHLADVVRSALLGGTST